MSDGTGCTGHRNLGTGQPTGVCEYEDHDDHGETVHAERQDARLRFSISTDVAGQVQQVCLPFANACCTPGTQLVTRPLEFFLPRWRSGEERCASWMSAPRCRRLRRCFVASGSNERFDDVFDGTVQLDGLSWSPGQCSGEFVPQTRNAGSELLCAPSASDSSPTLVECPTRALG